MFSDTLAFLSTVLCGKRAGKGYLKVFIFEKVSSDTFAFLSTVLCGQGVCKDNYLDFVERNLSEPGR